VNGVQILLIIGVGIAVSAYARRRGVEAGLIIVAVRVNLTLDPKHQYPGAYLTRLQEEGVWPVVDFLLETFVFAYIGLQLKFVLQALAASDQPGLGPTLIAAGTLLAAAIVLRLAGVRTVRAMGAGHQDQQLAARPATGGSRPPGTSAGPGAVAAGRWAPRRRRRRCWSAGPACAASSRWPPRRRYRRPPRPVRRSRAGTRSRPSR
jgi:hypothetical protein